MKEAATKTAQAAEIKSFTGSSIILLYTMTLTVVLLLSGCSGDEKKIYIPYQTGDTLAFTFKDGSQPYLDYHGTRDAVLKSSREQHNFGVAPEDTVGLYTDGLDTHEFRLIIAFDLSMVQNCSEVIEARLQVTLSAVSATDSLVLEAHRVTGTALNGSTWVEGSGGFAAGVSWLTIDGGAPWNNKGGDFDVTPLDRVKVLGDTLVSFDLPPSLILDWINNPDDNHGVIVVPISRNGDAFGVVHMREDSNISSRPALWMKYIKGG